MSNALNALVSAFAQPQQKTGGSDRFKKYYPFWKMNAGEQAVVRFLPDANQENPWGFMVENLTHKLEINGQRKTLPCLSMYGESCPCCIKAKAYYDANDEDNGRKFYKKREYIAPIVVLNSPFETEGDDLVKVVSLGPKIFKLIQDAFTSGDLEEAPFDMKGGYDFRIKKSMQGQYADYTLSSFAPRQSALDEDLQAKIELLNLDDFRTGKITKEAMEAQILAAETGGAVAGGGLNIPNQVPVQTPVTEQVAVQTPAATAAPTPTPEVAQTAAAPAADNKADDILAQIRNRVAAQ